MYRQIPEISDIMYLHICIFETAWTLNNSNANNRHLVGIRNCIANYYRALDCACSLTRSITKTHARLAIKSVRALMFWHQPSQSVRHKWNKKCEWLAGLRCWHPAERNEPLTAMTTAVTATLRYAEWCVDYDDVAPIVAQRTEAQSCCNFITCSICTCECGA